MGNMCALAPYRVEGATFHGFVLDSRYDRLNELLDEQLGALTGGALRFAALLPVVFVTYVSIARSLSLSTDPADAGVYVENDLMCWLLVAQFSGEAIVPERTGFYAPLVWVDHPVALVEGRETFGYPKGFGTISIPTADAPPVYACDAFTFPGAATLPVTPQRVSTVRGPGGWWRPGHPLDVRRRAARSDLARAGRHSGRAPVRGRPRAAEPARAICVRAVSDVPAAADELGV
jgi:hypothetical protein